MIIGLFSGCSILMLLNKRQLEKLKEEWWTNDEYQSKCEKPEDQSDGISIQNIGGVFIVIFVGIGMACVTLIFEYWWYKYRKNPKIIDVSKQTVTRSEAPRMSTFPEKKDSPNKNATLRSRNLPLPTNFRTKY